jgi:hypothetical protein
MNTRTEKPMPTLTCTRVALPVHASLPEVPRTTAWCQRWNQRQHSWTHRRAGGFRAELYRVVPITERTARAYVCTHHYSGSFPAARRSYGLYLTGTAPTDPTTPPDPHAPEDSDLVGVAVFGIPVRRAVLTNPLPDLQPYVESLELSRFVLEGDALAPGRPPGRAPGNSESWFLARALEQLADHGVRAVVAFSDPVPRIINGRTVFPGHQASNAHYAGRSTPRLITLLPDGTTLSDRAISKIRKQETGHAYAERRLIALGANPRIGGAAGAPTWLADALHEIGAIRVRHGGCHRYILAATRAQRRALRDRLDAQPYPRR